MAYKLRQQGIDREQQLPLKVYFENDIVVGDYFADLVVEHKIIIELKTVERLRKIHFSQVKNYLKAIHYRLGILINFDGAILEFKRIIL